MDKYKKIRPKFLDDFIITPNHVHGIVRIKEVEDIVETHCNASLPKSTFGPQRQNLASIIRGFKGSCKRLVDRKLNNENFQWQRNYYKHIIRDEENSVRIRQYIANNLMKWKFDRNNRKYFKN